MDYYFCTDTQNVEGPVSILELTKLRLANRINDETQVTKAGSESWRAYKDEFPDSVKSFDIEGLYTDASALHERVEPPPLWQPSPWVPTSAPPPRELTSKEKRGCCLGCFGIFIIFLLLGRCTNNEGYPVATPAPVLPPSSHSSPALADHTPAETFSLGWFGPKVTVRGDVATFEHTILADLTPKLAGFQLAKEVYDAATKRRDLNQIVITCSMTVPGGFVDKYGKTVDGPLMMGSITISNLNEVRRYEDEGAYALDTEMSYAAQIMSMNYSYLLSK